MDTSDFQVGKVYYTEHGEKVELLAITTDGKYVVAQELEYEGYEGTAYGRGPVFFAWQLFKKAPRELADEELISLKKQAQELREQNASLRRETLDAARENTERMKKLSAYKGLERIEDFIEGRITHLVVEEYGLDWSIQPVSFLDYITRDNYHYGRKPGTDGVRLVVLFGNSKGDLTWRVNDYKDGSGSGFQKIIPCASEEEAIGIRKQLASEALSGANSETSDHLFQRRVQAALKYGVMVPQSLVERYNKAEAEDRAKKRASLQDNLNKASEALHKFEAEVQS